MDEINDFIKREKSKRKSVRSIQRSIFPTPPKYTIDQAQDIIKKWYDLKQGERRTIQAQLFGTMNARLSSGSSKSYNLGARLFYLCLEQLMKDIEQTKTESKKPITWD